jgi:acyl-CoA reductase-like NAD-dependent aldehyde dehydrogenase
MKKSRYSEEQIAMTLRLAESGTPVREVGRQMGLSEATFSSISFTGSPEVGTLIQKSTADNHVPCVLELGGKSPQIVFEDANLEKALPVVIGAIVQNAGQTCSVGGRLLAQRSRPVR